ncbi:MAG TPA: hypothetical protein VGO01_25850, partial [Bradyrhizobium sp.]|nr:hypothetical protein [Bradyrhizobium sp.]
AAIIAVARSLAPFSQGGRVWPDIGSLDATLDLAGYAVEGFAQADVTALRVAELFRHLPVAVVRARYAGAVKAARKAVRAEA